MINRYNYQTGTTNRFVVDSKRFWRSEFNPRFNQLFTVDDFKTVVNTVNDNLSFSIDATNIDLISKYLYDHLAGERFALVPCKNKDAKNQFLAHMFFTLDDVLGRIAFKKSKITDDDFNVVDNSASTRKVDTTRINTQDDISSKTTLNVVDNNIQNALMEETGATSATNVLDESDTNANSVTDVFLSPQNQGQQVTNTNTKHEGVDGVPLLGSAAFSTNSTATKDGDSVKQVSATDVADTGYTNRVSNDIASNNTNETVSDLKNMHQNGTENQKADDYNEALHYDKGARLKDFLDIQSLSFWIEILDRLSLYVLKVDIATGDRNYFNCDYYE